MELRPKNIDWTALAEEFLVFQLDREACKIGCDPFLLSLASPVPHFVKVLLEKRSGDDSLDPEQLKVLFFFLLHKRYTERLNLLHFAFNLFDDDCHLPEEIVAQVPFPHEDGIPGYALRLDPDYKY